MFMLALFEFFIFFIFYKCTISLDWHERMNTMKGLDKESTLVQGGQMGTYRLSHHEKSGLLLLSLYYLIFAILFHLCSHRLRIEMSQLLLLISNVEGCSSWQGKYGRQ